MAEKYWAGARGEGKASPLVSKDKIISKCKAEARTDLLIYGSRILQNNVGTDAKLGVQAFGQRHGDAAATTHYLAEG